jgi:hypothetical protein
MTALLDTLTINTPLDFAHALEAAEGWPQTADNDKVLVGWDVAEGNGFSYRNPYNTTQKEPGATYGGGAVAHYPDWATAIKGTVDALNSGGGAWYAAVRNDLASGASAAQTAHDIEASPWAGGHYGATKASGYAGGNLERIVGSPGFAPSNVAVPGAGPSTSADNPATLTVSNPISWIGDLFGGAKKDIAKIVLTGIFLSGGGALVVLGAWRSLSPDTRQSIKSTATTAATVAAA